LQWRPRVRAKSHPQKLCATKRRVPACFAAARRWSRPSVRRRLVKANTRSNRRRSLAPLSAVISCTMTSGLAAITASRTAAPSSASTIAASAPARRITTAASCAKNRHYSAGFY
jgi:hypothetical protein